MFSKLGFEKLTESVLGGSSGEVFRHGSILSSLFFSYLCGGKSKTPESLILMYRVPKDISIYSAEHINFNKRGIFPSY